MAERLALLAVLLLLGAWGQWRPQRPRSAPPRIPAEQAEPWMVDALPGIGPRRRDAALAAVRAARLDQLPKAARAPAREAFSRHGGR